MGAVPSRPLLLAAAAALVVGAAPSSAQDRAGSWTAIARVGAQLPADLYSTSPPELGVGPCVELGIAYSFLPWLEVELAAGWALSQAPPQTELVKTDPSDPMAPVTPVQLTRQLTTVPLTATLRLSWPGLQAVRPYAAVGGGAIYGSYLVEFTSTGHSTGWGPEVHVGLGVDAQVGPRWVLGVEGRWRGAIATLWQENPPPLSGSWATSFFPNLGSVSLLATAAWRF